MTTTPCFTLQTADHVAHLVLSRPGVMNTMNPQFWRELEELLVTQHKDNSARALVISSTGKHFSAGMALETFGGGIQMNDQNPEGRAAIFDSDACICAGVPSNTRPQPHAKSVSPQNRDSKP